MDEYRKYFAGKKITVMGLGLLGGLGDIKFLAMQGADLIVTDLKREDEVQPALTELKAFPNISYTLGSHKLEDFRNRDLIVKAPSTPLDSPYIAEAKKRNIPVTMWAALFCRFARTIGAPIVGVTGTRGKSTTTAMIAHVLRSAEKKVIEGGNVRGTSMVAQLPQLKKSTYVVLELDSWKLQGFGEEKISPHVAVFTNFLQDHMNYYKGDMDAYFRDKAYIYKYQSADDTLVTGRQVAKVIRSKRIPQKGKLVVVGADDLPPDWTLMVPGEHNRENASCAIAATRALGIREDSIKTAIESFRGVEGRLQLLREVRGVQIYNDNNATTADATIAALRALGRDRNVVLIMGGSDKGLDMSSLFEEIERTCKAVVLLPGTGTDTVRPSLNVLHVAVNDATTLEGAVEAAMREARAGDIVLFSPAFASFGIFKNEYDRGDQFVAVVEKL